MRVLLIAWYFPPHNDVGALRTGAFARFLRANGHDVHVLTAVRAASDNSLQIPIDPDGITRTPWFDVDTWSTQNESKLAKRPSRPTAGATSTPSALRSRLGLHYRNLVRLPDRQIGWLPYLLKAGGKILSSQKFDLIFASGPPFTTFLAARSLSRKFSVPWFAEYRDAWFEDLYASKPRWRRAIDRFLEDRTLTSARGIVAISAPWAEHFSSRFRKPTIAVYNGFDQSSVPTTNDRPNANTEPLSIIYAGILYEGKRDPSCLYQAVKLSNLTPRDIQIDFYGPTAQDVAPLAERFGVTDFVRVFDRVPYSESLEIQRKSDILLLLQPSEDAGNVPAKFFEYIAARRPILGLGLDAGVPAGIIRNRSAGFYVTDASKVAEQLQRWVSQKRHEGCVPDIPGSAQMGLSRIEQFENLLTFLQSRLEDCGGAGGASSPQFSQSGAP
jgi:glycosyltransferase involved in cell wall biosynthesis